MLKVDARNLGNVTVLSLQGRLVNGETENLRQTVRSLAEVRGVILDLERVSTVDASGLGLMLELRAQVEAKGMRFELMNVGKWVKRVLEITRLDSVFRINSAVEFFPRVARRDCAPGVAWASCA